MSTRDPRVDAYLAKAAPFAKPILERLRALVHRSDPEITETIKWGSPFFELDGIVAAIAAFKAHCAFVLWKGDDIVDTSRGKEARGQLGRLTSVADLPSDADIVAWVRTKIARNRSGGNPVTPKRAPKPPIAVPPPFAAALRRSPKAKQHFDAFAPSHRREYLEWITEAKTDATRDRRIATAVEWIGDGKSFRWKYERPKPAAITQSAKKAPVKKAPATKPGAGKAAARKVAKKPAAKSTAKRPR